ncbi:hypothetical protein ABW19_dt0205773 [Dactylella cylindrospora]|nr:hypothetical protein ABW19_dt0205773 [Dactylella cylindrospora]
MAEPESRSIGTVAVSAQTESKPGQFPGTSSILRLPSLVIHNLTFYCCRQTLRDLRLVHPIFLQEATRRLFSTCYIRNCEEGAARFNSVCDAPEVAKFVKTVALKAYDEPDTGGGQHEAEFYPAVKTAYLRSAELSNLSGLELLFSPVCDMDSEGRGWAEPAESVRFRTEVLHLLLRLYDSLPSPAKIRSLSIQCIQNYVESEILESASFKYLISSLSALSLYIVSSSNSAEPENDIWFYEVHEFARDLPKIWLAPSASTVRELTLFFDRYHGFEPKLDLREVHFPCLQKLALGNHIFWRDWQIDWITSHASSLENLYMDDCAILFAARNRGIVDQEGYMSHDQDTRRIEWRSFNYQTYSRRWHEVFNRFAIELPGLREFRFGSGIGTDEDTYVGAFNDCNMLAISLPHKRYLLFDIGIGPSQYIDATSAAAWETSGTNWKRPACAEEDRVSLLNLLSRTGQVFSSDDVVAENFQAGTYNYDGEDRYNTAWEWDGSSN